MANDTTKTQPAARPMNAAGPIRTSAAPYIPAPRPAPTQTPPAARSAPARPTRRAAQPPQPIAPTQPHQAPAEPADQRQSQPTASRQQREFVPPAAGFFKWLVSSNGRQRQKGSITATKRGIYLLGGMGLIGFSTWLTTLFMMEAFPALQAPGDQKALIVSLAANTVFFLVELFVWEGQHSPAVWIICLCIMGFDLTVNIVGCQKLFGLKELLLWKWLPDGATLFVIIVGAGAAILPEKFINAGIRG